MIPCDSPKPQAPRDLQVATPRFQNDMQQMLVNSSDHLPTVIFFPLVRVVLTLLGDRIFLSHGLRNIGFTSSHFGVLSFKLKEDMDITKSFSIQDFCVAEFGLDPCHIRFLISWISPCQWFLPDLRFSTSVGP